MEANTHNTQGVANQSLPFDKLPLVNPDKHIAAQTAGRKFDKIYSRFTSDIQELVDEMGGDDFMKVEVGTGGLSDINVHFSY